MLGTLKKVSPRVVVRGAFLLFFAYLCVRLWMFYLWTAGKGPYVSRPEAATGLIPVGAYMSFFLWLKTGVFDAVLPAGVVIVIAALLLSFFFKRGFCGWICPVGSVWEASAWAGRRFRRAVPSAPRWLGRNLPVPAWLDKSLRGVRYVLAGLFMFWLAVLPAQQAMDFQQLPYYAVSDIKILSLLVRITPVYLLVAGGVFAASVLFGNIWCRYLCPLGGVYGALGAASPCTVVRDEQACIDCKRCAKVCHAGVRVDKLKSVHAPECDGCQDCVIACPVEGALKPSLFGLLKVQWWVWPVAVVGVWLAVYAVALATGHWHTALPDAGFANAARAIGL